MFKLAVVGSRNLADYLLVEKTLDAYYFIHGNDLEIVSGGAKGADSLAARYAQENDLKLHVFLPEWNKYGKSAGFRRNTLIWDISDAGVAFWDGVSKGTSHSFDIAKSQGKELEIVEFTPTDMKYTT